MTISGFVPHVTCGLIASTSTVISLSNVAPSSVNSSLQSSCTVPPCSRTQAKVVSSGAIMPARPPPSMVMLQIVMRPSIESARMTSPENSTTWPAAPATPICPIVARMRSLAVTPLPIEPT